MVKLFEWAIERRTMVADVSSYNVVLKALGRRKFFAFMESVLSEMRSKGLKTDNETLFIFTDSFVKGKHVSKALCMFGKLEEFGMEYERESADILNLALQEDSGDLQTAIVSYRNKFPRHMVNQ
ncbi:putative tetratricopeptide-like helical domain superfamily [Helianthus annuus]|nr:putative tetratricopeptide-like helical domain superfamily [Helianthus annuus]